MTKEIENYLLDLNELRQEVKTLLEGLPMEALDWRPIEGQGDLATNSLAVIVAHLAGSENYWMKEVIGGQPIRRDRLTEFSAQGVNIAELRAGLETTAKNTETTLSALKPTQLEESRNFRERQVTIRWCILHVIEHLSTHIGHMQLTRQLWMAKFRK